MSELTRRAMALYDVLAGCRTWQEFADAGWTHGPGAHCERYWLGRGRCEGCPVAAFTGLAKCHGSPWGAMAAAIERLYPAEVIREPLPEVLAMREFLDGLDWSGQP